CAIYYDYGQEGYYAMDYW
nr:immunoglobulin heavy chain junction region [Mus musculus]